MNNAMIKNNNCLKNKKKMNTCYIRSPGFWNRWVYLKKAANDLLGESLPPVLFVRQSLLIFHCGNQCNARAFYVSVSKSFIYCLLFLELYDPLFLQKYFSLPMDCHRLYFTTIIKLKLYLDVAYLVVF